MVVNRGGALHRILVEGCSLLVGYTTESAVYCKASEVVAMATGSKVIHSNPNILAGTPVFVGTRVPVQNFIDCLEAGDSIEDFLASFPSVTREQAIAALELAREALETSAYSAG